MEFDLFMEHLLQYLRNGCEIAILSFLIYFALVFLRGTRSAAILAGITLLILVLTGVSSALELRVIQWLLMQLWAFLALSFLIIFQPEIRRAFAEIGSQQALIRPQSGSKQQKEMIQTLVDSTFALAGLRIGALISIEQEIGFRSITETGTLINAPLSKELLMTFFYPNTPLHDGGVIINKNQVIAAGCIFPLTDSAEFTKSLGTRHRAGVGITEETDAVSIIVSEETGSVSLAYKGRLLRGLSKERLERHLRNHLSSRRRRNNPPGQGGGILSTGLNEIQTTISQLPKGD